MPIKDVANKSMERRNFLKISGMIGAAAVFSSTLAACSSGDTGTSTGADASGAAGSLALTAGISYALSTGFDPMTS